MDYTFRLHFASLTDKQAERKLSAGLAAYLPRPYARRGSGTNFRESAYGLYDPFTFQVWSRHSWRGSANDGRSCALSLAKYQCGQRRPATRDLKASEFSSLTLRALLSDPLRERLDPQAEYSGKDRTRGRHRKRKLLTSGRYGGGVA
jgi:hypothetical protein